MNHVVMCHRFCLTVLRTGPSFLLAADRRAVWRIDWPRTRRCSGASPLDAAGCSQDGVIRRESEREVNAERSCDPSHGGERDMRVSAFDSGDGVLRSG